MKKGLLAIFAMLCVTATASAQGWGFGPKVGATFANVNGLEGTKMKAGVVAGMFAERDINNWFSIQAELLWSQQGYHQKMAGEAFDTRLSYGYLPVVTKYYLIGGMNVQLGAQFGYLVTSKATGSPSLKPVINKYNVDALVGLGYDFNCGLMIEGRYNIGLTNLQRTNDPLDLRNATMEVMVGWKF